MVHSRNDIWCRKMNFETVWNVYTIWKIITFFLNFTNKEIYIFLHFDSSNCYAIFLCVTIKVSEELVWIAMKNAGKSSSRIRDDTWFVSNELFAFIHEPLITTDTGANPITLPTMFIILSALMGHMGILPLIFVKVHVCYSPLILFTLDFWFWTLFVITTFHTKIWTM